MKKRLFSKLILTLSITTCFMGVTANAQANDFNEDYKFNLEDSKLNQYASFPEVQNQIDDLTKNATAVKVDMLPL